jgi:hypothetical protein
MLWCGIVLHRFGSPHLEARAALALGLVAGWLVSCNYPKPPAAWTGAPPAPTVTAPPPPPAAPPPPPPPPPPPKCEDLAENCAAQADTRLYVGDGGAWFTPPEGWHYARTPNGSVARHPGGGALLVLKPAPDPADLGPALDALVSEQGVKGFKLAKFKHRLKKPQQTLPAAEGTVDLWEVDAQTLSLDEQGNGTLLVLVGRPAPEHTLLGIGFVTEGLAETEAAKIMQSVQTLRGKP